LFGDTNLFYLSNRSQAVCFLARRAGQHIKVQLRHRSEWDIYAILIEQNWVAQNR